MELQPTYADTNTILDKKYNFCVNVFHALIITLNIERIIIIKYRVKIPSKYVQSLFLLAKDLNDLSM